MTKDLEYLAALLERAAAAIGRAGEASGDEYLQGAASAYTGCARLLRAVVSGELTAMAEHFGAEGEPTHRAACYDDDGKLECVCSLAGDIWADEPVAR